MYLFSRRRQLNPAQARKATAFAVDIGQRAREISGLDVSVWTTVLSADVGVISWAVLVEHLTDLESGMDKLAVDGTFNDLVEQNDGLFVGAVSDVLAQVVAGMPAADAPQPAWATIVQATCANGQLAAGMAGGVEIAEVVTRIGGLSTMFLAASTGEYGSVSWITGASSLAEIEESEAKVNNDPEFIALVDRVATAYLPHAAVTMYRRIS